MDMLHHLGARGGSDDREQLEYNATVIEQLHKSARADHERIVGHVAFEKAEAVDQLQAKTLYGAPFGHRCTRSLYGSSSVVSDNSAGPEGEGEGEAGEEQATSVTAELGPVCGLPAVPMPTPPLPVAA
jgi:hypothetical protein